MAGGGLVGIGGAAVVGVAGAIAVGVLEGACAVAVHIVHIVDRADVIVVAAGAGLGRAAGHAFAVVGQRTGADAVGDHIARGVRVAIIAGITVHQVGQRRAGIHAVGRAVSIGIRVGRSTATLAGGDLVGIVRAAVVGIAGQVAVGILEGVGHVAVEAFVQRAGIAVIHGDLRAGTTVNVHALAIGRARAEVEAVAHAVIILVVAQEAVARAARGASGLQVVKPRRIGAVSKAFACGGGRAANDEGVRTDLVHAAVVQAHFVGTGGIGILGPAVHRDRPRSGEMDLVEVRIVIVEERQPSGYRSGVQENGIRVGGIPVVVLLVVIGEER